MTKQLPLEKLRLWMNQAQVDAYIVRISDPYLSEYIPRHWASLEWLSGFSGSAGTLIVTRTGGALFTDSRYWEQAEKQIEGTGLSLVCQGKADAPGTDEWLALHCGQESSIAASPDFFSIAEWRSLGDKLANFGIRLIPVDDPIDAIWTEGRPERPRSKVRHHQEASLPTSEKLNLLREYLSVFFADSVILCALDDIAWLTNCRGSDIEFNPVFLSTMIVTRKEAVVFTETDRFTAEHLSALAKEGVRVLPVESFERSIGDLTGDVMLVDPNRVSAGMMEKISCAALESISPVTLMKSRKSDAEIESIRQAMISDGVALCEFFSRLDTALEAGEVKDEMTLSRELHNARATYGKGFFDLSFETISAFGPNAALPHYTPSDESSATLSNGLLLIDSGGQYETGTTDITRMTAVGTLSDDMRRDVTYVLKAMIALAKGLFPIGSSGAQLDAVARAPLWSRGLNFGHGTGHGVGYVLNVHEGPFRVSPYAFDVGELGLQPGLVFSDEPGVYRPGKWGVRIENLLAAVPAGKTEFDEFIRFETLTLCPIDRRTFMTDLLTQEEIDWVDDYHKTVREKLSAHLTDTARIWLEKVTRPLIGD